MTEKMSKKVLINFPEPKEDPEYVEISFRASKLQLIKSNYKAGRFYVIATGKIEEPSPISFGTQNINEIFLKGEMPVSLLNVSIYNNRMMF